MRAFLILKDYFINSRPSLIRNNIHFLAKFQQNPVKLDSLIRNVIFESNQDNYFEFRIIFDL